MLPGKKKSHRSEQLSIELKPNCFDCIFQSLVFLLLDIFTRVPFIIKTDNKVGSPRQETDYKQLRC